MVAPALLRLGHQIATAGDDVQLAGAELAHPRAGLGHVADFDPVVDRTPQQRIPARGLQRDELLRLAGDDVVGARRQRVGAEAIECLLRHVAVRVIRPRGDVEREYQRGEFQVEGRRALREIDLDRLSVDHFGFDADALERAGDLRVREFAR